MKSGETNRMTDTQSSSRFQFDADTAIGEVLDLLRRVSHSLRTGFSEARFLHCWPMSVRFFASNYLPPGEDYSVAVMTAEFSYGVH